LVPPDPIEGLICRYGPQLHLGQNGAGTGSLASSLHLRKEQAVALADAIRQIDLTSPPGSASCPADDGEVTLIGLAYADRADVGLWYKSSGCQTLDNGRIGAAEIGNPSFYEDFASVIDQLSPVRLSQGCARLGPEALISRDRAESERETGLSRASTKEAITVEFSYRFGAAT
jgi:hypothetical protein